MGTTYAVLIGIETYQKQGISSVQFAQADAAAMKDLLVQELGVPAENITVWLDFEATKSVFENDLPYLIRQLAPGDSREEDAGSMERRFSSSAAR